MNDHIAEQNEETMHKSENSLFVGGVLILVGAVVLAGSLTGFTFRNWWVLFLLIPVGGILANAWRDYQENGRLTRRSASAIIPGLVLLTMVAIFLFDLNWTIFWPITLIAVGVSTLVGRG